jgi:integrase
MVPWATFCIFCFQHVAGNRQIKSTKIDKPCYADPMSVSLNYKRCHGTECEGSHKPKTFTSESEERKKGWKRCKCPIVANGTLDRVAKRMATKQTDWSEAARMMAPYIAANSWEIAADPVPPLPSPTSKPASGKTRMKLQEAFEKYLEAHEEAESAHGTVRGYRFLKERLLRFVKRTGAAHMDQWDNNNDIVKQYLNECMVKRERIEDTTRRQYHKMINAFFRYSEGKKWIAHNPAKMPVEIHNRKTKAAKKGKPRHAFTNSCLERMYAACYEYDQYTVSHTGEIKPRNGAPNHRTWNGEDLLDFILLSVYTGLRISDIVLFHISRLRGQNEVEIRTTKNDEPVYTVVPLWLADRIRIRAQKFGPYIFGEHEEATKLETITGQWRTRLTALWEICGAWEIHPTPHRFRHTFIRILLENGKSYRLVADLVGDTEEVIRKYYSHWSPKRQQLISESLEESFADVPAPVFGPRQVVVKFKQKAS